MAHHPVTPMDEGDIRLHLARQTHLPVGLIDLTDLNSGSALSALARERSGGARIVALDVVDDATLIAAGRLIWDQAQSGQLFVLGSHVDDKFGAYTTYSSLSVGHSSRWFKSRDKSVDVELGPGYFTGTRATGESENGVTVRGAASMRWQVSPSALFTQTVSMERGTSNLHSQAESALSTKINGTMQLKAAFSARSDTNVPEEKKNTDTQTSLTLVYSF